MKLHKDCKLRTGQTDIEVLFSTLGFKWNNKMYCKVSLGLFKSCKYSHLNSFYFTDFSQLIMLYNYQLMQQFALKLNCEFYVQKTQ